MEQPHWHHSYLNKQAIAREGGTFALKLIISRFQFFTAVNWLPEKTGYTLFSSSSLIFRYLPRHTPFSYLRQLTWSARPSFFDSTVLTSLPLVVTHPSTGRDCLHCYEPWPQSKTAFEATEVIIENGGQGVCDVLDSLLHDRYWHAWEKGNMVVSDNTSMMHTRSSFISGSERQIWRIHID
jgi:hypothetical protein